MARIAVLDDYEDYLLMVSAPLLRAGHQVYRHATENGPIDFERLIAFEPQVVSVALYRLRAAFDRPVRNLGEDILGYEPLMEMERYPAIQLIPTLIIGNGLQEKDVPTSLHYDAFLVLPDDIKRYEPTVADLANVVKSRRKISRFLCPKCRGRLTYIRQPVIDLFCPRCHCAVSLIDGEGCIARDADGEPIDCSMDQLEAPVDRLT